MTSNTPKQNFAEQKFIKPVYIFLLFFMGLTGFAQMPIFKRYYIADIPGLGWLAQFYVTHTMHYIGAICLLFVIAYSAAIYLGIMRKQFHLTISAYINIVLMGSIIVTGIFRVLKNLPDVVFSPSFTMFIDISHLGFMLVLMSFGIFTLVMRIKWLRPSL